MQITLQKCVRYITDSDYRFLINNQLGFYHNMPDDVFLKRLFHASMGENLNLSDPQTYNEKLQWLKLYDRNPEYTRMVDKYEAKRYVAEKIGEKYIIPTIGVWNSFDEIPIESLPDKFVLKCAHDSGGIIIVKDKEKFQVNEAKNVLNRKLKKNFYYFGREWPYKNVLPRVLAEKYMVCADGNPAGEYKIFCFNGKAKMILVCKGGAHGAGRTNDYCDLELKRMPFTSLYPNSTGELERPHEMDKMIDLAERLAGGIPQVRVDMYLCGDAIYFGEMTFYHNAGFCRIEPYEWDIELGSWIEFPKRRP